MESASAHVPVVAISSQIPRDLIGRGRGFLHDLPDQLASFAPIVKQARRAESADGLAELVADAWRRRAHAADGPGLSRGAGRRARRPGRHGRCPSASTRAPPAGARPRPEAIAEAARAARGRRAARPVGGRRGRALGRLGGAARARRAPARARSPPPTWARAPSRRAIRCASARAATTRPSMSCSRSADVVLGVGTELGAETTAPVRAALLRSADPDRRRARADRRDLPGAGLVGDAAARARRAAAARARSASADGEPSAAPRQRARAHRAPGSTRRDASSSAASSRTSRRRPGPRRGDRLGHDDHGLLGGRAPARRARRARSSTRSARARSATPGRLRSARSAALPGSACSA